MLRKVLGWIFNGWVLAALLLLLLLALVWVIGPLVAVADWRPLEGENARWVATAVVVAVAAAIVGWRTWRARSGNEKVVQQLMAAPAGPAADGESADLAAVRARFEGALQMLRSARFSGPAGAAPRRWQRLTQRLSGRYLYELPWYLFIGAPGSGKTTALRNAGLQFPLAAQMGEQAVRGVGGTRNCDWWFTDRAVLIDTAGRFTTQDSDQATDRSTWNGFLALLRTSRPRQPLNGVLVTASLSDLIGKGSADRARHAQTVRQRLQELHEQLGIRLPIYLLVTKCDLMIRSAANASTVFRGSSRACARPCRNSSSRSSRPRPSRPTRCCAASISSAAPRRAARSTACSVRWHAATSWNRPCCRRSRAAGAATSCSAC